MVESQFPRINGYEIIDSIGEGGIGKVYEIEKDNTKNKYAMKIVPKEEGHELVKLQQSCNHKSLIKIHDRLEKNDKMILIMDLVNSTLQNELRKRRMKGTKLQPFSEEEVRMYLKQIISGTIHCKKHHLDLRDISPRHIYITNEVNSIKLGNHGILTILQDDRITGPPSADENLDKISEKIYKFMEKRYENTNIDIWRLGLIAYEMITLEFPFKGIDDLISMDEIEELIKDGQFNFCKLEQSPISKILFNIIVDLITAPKKYYQRLITEFKGDLEFDVLNVYKQYDKDDDFYGAQWDTINIDMNYYSSEKNNSSPREDHVSEILDYSILPEYYNGLKQSYSITDERIKNMKALGHKRKKSTPGNPLKTRGRDWTDPLVEEERKS